MLLTAIIRSHSALNESSVGLSGAHHHLGSPLGHVRVPLSCAMGSGLIDSVRCQTLRTKFSLSRAMVQGLSPTRQEHEDHPHTEDCQRKYHQCASSLCIRTGSFDYV